jgi:hypothetical protein
MVKPLDLRYEGVKVLELHVEDEDRDIEMIDLFELLFKHGGSEVPLYRKRGNLFLTGGI